MKVISQPDSAFTIAYILKASERLADAEASASTDHRRAQRDQHSYRSSIYPAGAEFALCHAEAQLMTAVVGVLNESLTESIKGFYKLRKAFITLDGILQAETKFMNGLPRTSRNSMRSVESFHSQKSVGSNKQTKAPENDPDLLRKHAMTTNASQEAEKGALDQKEKDLVCTSAEDDEEDDEFYDADEDHEIQAKPNTYTGHIEVNGTSKKAAENSTDSSVSSDWEKLTSPTSSPAHQTLDQDPDSDIFSNPIDVFIHSGANLCFGLLLVMISMIPPAFSKLLFIIGFHGDRDRGLNLLWQASKFHNINGAMAGLCLLGYYNAIVGFADILPEPTGSGENQSVQGYPKERCEALLVDMRTRHPKSQLWLLEEARMEAMNRRLEKAMSILQNAAKQKSPLKQVAALNMFETSLEAMYMHEYELCAESFIKCVSMNNWSHALYYYIAGAVHVELYRLCKIRQDLVQAEKHANIATEYLQTAPQHAGKKKFMARQLPFDVLVNRKIQKWSSRAKEWHCTFIDAIGVSPLEEMIFFWNGYKRMDSAQLESSLERLRWSEMEENERFWKREEKDERAVLAVLRAATMREMGRWEEAESCLREGVLKIDKSELKGGLRDDWTGPCGSYEMGVVCWMRGKRARKNKENGDGNEKKEVVVDGKSEDEWAKECEGWIEKAAKWESYELDARIGLKVATAQDTLKKYWDGIR